MPRREQYIEQLEAYLSDERIVGLAATRWHNPRSQTTPLYTLFDEIQPTIDYLKSHGGTGSKGQKLISQIKSALIVADKGLEHGESSGSVAALRAFVAIQNAAQQEQIDTLLGGVKENRKRIKAHESAIANLIRHLELDTED